MLWGRRKKIQIKRTSFLLYILSKMLLLARPKLYLLGFDYATFGVVFNIFLSLSIVKGSFVAIVLILSSISYLSICFSFYS